MVDKVSGMWFGHASRCGASAVASIFSGIFDLGFGGDGFLSTKQYLMKDQRFPKMIF